MKRPRLFAQRAAGVAGAGVGLVLIAFLFDAAPLFVPAVGLVLVALAAWLWVLASFQGVRVSRTLPAERVVEEQPLAATIEVRRGPIGLPGAEVIDPFTGSRLDLGGPLSLLRGGRQASVRVVTRFPRRGVQVLPPPRLVIGDPLQLVRVESVGAGPPQQLLVLPATERVRWLTASRARRLHVPEGSSASEALAAIDLDGLRPYRPGAPASRIHWPALARGAGLIERRLRADGDTRPMVVLDARVSGLPSAQATALLDAAVRAAASLTLELARSGGCGLLLPGDQRPTTIDRELVNWPDAHARLAVVSSAGARAPGLGSRAGRVGAMVYISVRAPERLATLAGEGGHSQVVLVVPEAGLIDGRPPGVRGSAVAMLEVSGCRGFVLGRRRERDPLRAVQTAAK